MKQVFFYAFKFLIKKLLHFYKKRQRIRKKERHKNLRFYNNRL